MPSMTDANSPRSQAVIAVRRHAAFCSVSARRGIEQRQTRHPLGRLAENFQRDVAAHGKSGEREILRGSIEYDARHLHHGLAFGDRRHTHLGNVAKMRNLVTPDCGIAD
jgi:hypothetical protein